LGGATAKAFQPLGGKPMAVYSLRTLSTVPGVRSIVLVIGTGCEGPAARMLSSCGPWPVPVHLTEGGAERQDSVAAGLARVDAAAELIIVHDAARPFVSIACVRICVEAAATSGAAIVAMPARDTVKIASPDGAVIHTLDRRTVWLAQTPQVFRAALLRRAHEEAQRERYVATDDAALVERLGVTVHVVPGEAANQKITTPADLRWAEWHLRGGRD